jgi:predicted GNAT superfamily acetyltransferase
LGTCVDVNAKDDKGRSLFCSSKEIQEEIYKCAQQAGFTKIINECVKKDPNSSSTAPHFHLEIL